MTKKYYKKLSPSILWHKRVWHIEILVYLKILYPSFEMYFLKIHRIPGHGPSVLLQHGLLCTSASWLIAGRYSLAFLLNRYSRRKYYCYQKIRNNFFQYCDSKIGLFSIAPCKVITLNHLSILFGISSLLLFWWLSF